MPAKFVLQKCQSSTREITNWTINELRRPFCFPSADVLLCFCALIQCRVEKCQFVCVCLCMCVCLCVCVSVCIGGRGEDCDICDMY